MTDSVNSPSHYTQGVVETIELIELMGEDVAMHYCVGNAIKYISRAPYKGKQTEDIRKAIWYCKRLTERYDTSEIDTGLLPSISKKLLVHLYQTSPQLEYALIAVLGLKFEVALSALRDLDGP